MKRTLFALASVLSLLLCFATAVLWVLGVWWHADLESLVVRVNGKDWLQRHWELSLCSGDLSWQSDDILGQDQQDAPPSVGWHLLFTGRDALDRIVERLRPRWISRSRTLTPGRREIGVVAYQEIGIPYWCLIAVTAVLPAVWLLRGYRHRRGIAQNRCTVCGYDLRATPDRCPECGATVTMAVK